MPPALLITQCLQNDFVKRIGRHDPLPNLLHIGYEEARRLMGENPAEGPVSRVMQWAGEQSDEQLKIIHIRDWHDPQDPKQISHLNQCGDHCLQGTAGARFAFEETAAAPKDIAMIDSLTLNDFVATNLASLLAPFAGQSARIGIIGVWTEAKITFLAYELRTRYPDLPIAVGSALTASSSRAQHFVALDQLEKLLGVTVYSSLGAFTEFLVGKEMPLMALSSAGRVKLEFEDHQELSETDANLLRFLFRDCRSARCRCLDGGFSGNVVLGSHSVDMFGHQQAPHVIKAEIKEWPGPAFEVYSPVFEPNGSGLERRCLGQCSLLDAQAAREALAAAVQAYDTGRGDWPTASVAYRIQCVAAFLERMEKRRLEVARLLTWEIAKPWKDALQEFDRTVEYGRATISALKYLDRAGSRFVLDSGFLAQIRRSPYGVALCLGPYNYPLNEMYTTLLPALIMGNTVIAKLPRLGTLCNFPLLEAFADAFPFGGRKDSAEGILSVTDALRVFSIRTLVAAHQSPENTDLVQSIIQGRRSQFLTTDYLF